MARKKEFEEDEEVEEQHEAPKPKRSSKSAKKEYEPSERNEGWATWLYNLLGIQEVSSKQRVVWSDMNQELQMAGLQNEMFDGLSVDVMKHVASLRFTSCQAQHQLKIGSASEAPSYSMLNVIQNPNGWVVGRIDAEGGLMARVGQKGRYFDTKMGVQLAKEAHQNIVTFETDFPVLDAMFGLKWQLPSMVSLNYLQPVSDSVHLGVEGTYVGKQAITVFSVAGRYATPIPIRRSRAEKQQPTPSRSIATFQLSQSGIQLAYVKQVSDVFALTSEFQLGMTQNGLDSTFITGLDVKVADQVRSRVQADSTLTIKSLLEENFTGFTRLHLCSELDHKKQTYKIGVGIQLHL